MNTTLISALHISDVLDACMRLTGTSPVRVIDTDDKHILQYRMSAVMTKAIALDLQGLDSYTSTSITVNRIRDARKVLMSDVNVAIEIAKQIRDRIEAHTDDEDGLIVFQAAVYVTTSNGYVRLTDEDEATLTEGELERRGESRATRLGMSGGYVLVGPWLKGSDA